MCIRDRTGFDIPSGSGGGGGEGSTTKIVLGASVDKSTVKEGDPVRLTYTFIIQRPAICLTFFLVLYTVTYYILSDKIPSYLLK